MNLKNNEERKIEKLFHIDDPESFSEEVQDIDSDILKKAFESVLETQEGEIIRNSVDFSRELQKKTQESFNSVLKMYELAYGLGFGLIILSVALALYSAFSGQDFFQNPSTFLSAVLGGAGATDMTILLYKPAKKIQESRFNAAELMMGTYEWRFISMLSGREFQRLLENLDPDDPNYIETIKALKEILNAKKEIAIELMSKMQDLSK